MKIFGTKAMVHIPKQKREKLDAKSQEYVFVGYDEHTKGYRLYEPQSGKVHISRDVRFINEGTPSKPKEQRRHVVQLEIEEVVMPTASGPENRFADIDKTDDEQEIFFDTEVSRRSTTAKRSSTVLMIHLLHAVMHAFRATNANIFKSTTTLTSVEVQRSGAQTSRKIQRS